MISIASERPTEDEGGGTAPPDPLRRVVHAALAIYLMPVIAIVCAIGGASILIDKASRVARRVAIGPRRYPRPVHLEVVRPGQYGVKPTIAPDHRRARVGR